MKKYVIIFTHSGEPNVDIITSYLKKMDEHYIRLNTDQFPINPTTALSANLNDKGSFSFCFEGSIDFDAENIKSCWYRQPGVPQTELSSPYGYEQLVKGEAKATLWSLYTSLDTFWMNSPFVTRLLKDNKLYQMKIAAKVGLRIPDSILSQIRQDHK